MIMIIGSAEEYHAKHVYDRLKERGTSCFYLDTRTFPQSIKLSINPLDFWAESFLESSSNCRIPIRDIRSVYWRHHYGVKVPKEIPGEIAPMLYREIESMLGSFFRNLGDEPLWVNPPSAIERHRYKANQLCLLNRAGIPVPDTLVSNDPEAVNRFVDKHQGRVIYKPVSGGAHTEPLKPEDLSSGRLEDLRFSPVQFQEMIEGVDVRAYLIGEAVYAAEIQASTLDFRDDPDAPIVPIRLPKEVENQCRLLAEVLEYRFTGIDLRRTPDNRYVFIEGNPSPMFVHFENRTGYPITQSLIALLKATPVD